MSPFYVFIVIYMLLCLYFRLYADVSLYVCICFYVNLCLYSLFVYFVCIVVRMWNLAPATTAEEALQRNRELAALLRALDQLARSSQSIVFHGLAREHFTWFLPPHLPNGVRHQCGEVRDRCLNSSGRNAASAADARLLRRGSGFSSTSIRQPGRPYFEAAKYTVHLQPGPDEADPELRRCEPDSPAPWGGRITSSRSIAWTSTAHPKAGEPPGRAAAARGPRSLEEPYGRAGYVKVEHRLQSAIDNHARATVQANLPQGKILKFCHEMIPLTQHFAHSHLSFQVGVVAMSERRWLAIGMTAAESIAIFATPRRRAGPCAAQRDLQARGQAAPLHILHGERLRPRLRSIGRRRQGHGPSLG
jgi:hypothetical protein